jgi:hypothetical protein
MLHKVERCLGNYDTSCLLSKCQSWFVQTDWPGAMNDLSCFCKTALFLLLKNKQLSHWMHIVADEAYSPYPWNAMVKF